MAESDTILQLGIEAAREGNRDEARNLFSLLTRQEPDNLQAWLWLAGVAEGPDERRVALERVLELDPGNDMAVKGLQAMGVRTDAAAEARTPTPPRDVTPPAEPARPLTDEERYAAELDSAFDDYDALPRAAAPLRDESDVLDEDSGFGSSRATVAGSARERIAARRANTTPVRDDNDDDDDLVPARSGPSRFLWILLGLIALVVVLFLVSRLLGGGNQQTAQNGVATPQGGAAVVDTTATPSEANPVTGTNPLTGTEPLTGTNPVTGTEPLTGTNPVTGTNPPVQTPATPANPPASDLAGANPALVGLDAPLQASGWTYTFPSICGVSCATPWSNQIGSFTAQGGYVVVLVSVANNTGTDQQLPANFFVLKDAQGRVYDAQPQVSSAYVIRGVNADRSMEDPIPANGVLTTVPLIFDVQHGATNVTLFARDKTDQGWQVLNNVP